jgi:hypothetical protein
MLNTVTFTSVVVAATTAFATAKPFDTNRSFLMVQNKGTVDVYLSFEDTPVASTSIKIPAGAFFEPFSVPSNKLSVATTSGTADVLIVTSSTSSVVNA